MIKIATLNVRGFRNRRKRLTTFRYLKNEKYDIVLLQETFAVKKDIDQWKKEWGCDLLWMEPVTRHSQGNVMLLSKKLDATQLKYEIISTRIQKLTMLIEEKQFTVINCYAPSGDTEKKTFFSILNKLLCKTDDGFTVVVGDMNTMYDPQLDNINGAPHNTDVIDAFHKCFDKEQYKDVYRIMNPDKRAHTWYKNTPLTARRLDYIFLNDSCFNVSVSCNIKAFPMSDHDLVETTLVLDETKRGPGYFKLNNSILREQEYVEVINASIEQAKVEYSETVTAQQLWDLCKLKIKQVTVEYCKICARERVNTIESLKLQVDSVRNQIDQGANNEEMLNKYHNIQHKLEVLLHQECKGTQVRSKWVEQGEKNTKFFLNLEKTRAKHKTITAMQTANGNATTDQNEIGDHILNHYKQLYKQKNDFDQNMFDNFAANVDIPKLDEIEKQSCEGLLTNQ